MFLFGLVTYSLTDPWFTGVALSTAQDVLCIDGDGAVRIPRCSTDTCGHRTRRCLMLAQTQIAEALMHMGSFATIAKCSIFLSSFFGLAYGVIARTCSGLKNFKHVLINNAVHDSVGGQPTGQAEKAKP